MTVISRAANADISVTGSIVTTDPTPTAHETLSDGSDSTYVDLDVNELVSVGFEDLSMPSGAVMKQVAIIARIMHVNTVRVQGILGIDNFYFRNLVLPASDSGTTIATEYVGLATGNFSDANMDSMAFTLSCEQMMSPFPLCYVTSIAALVTYVEEPTVTIATPTSLQTFTEDNRPPIVWVPDLDPDGGPQFSYIVKVFEATVYSTGGFNFFSSPAVFTEAEFDSGTRIVRPDEVIPNGDYVVGVVVSQLVDLDSGTALLSDPTYIEFELDVDAPAEPDFTATEEDGSGRVRLDLESNTGDATTDGFEIWSDRGTIDEWELVRTLATTAPAGYEETMGITRADPAEIYDYESPNGNVKYRARAFHEYTTATAYSDWVYATAHPRSEWWLKHPTDPRLNLEVEIVSLGQQQRAGRKTIVQPLGRTDSVAIADTRGVETGELKIRTNDDYVLERLKELADSQEPLLLTAKSIHHEKDRWILLEDETVERLVDAGPFEWRNVTYSWSVTSRPPGGLVVLSNVYDYPDLILRRKPALYWRMSDIAAGATDVPDLSGNGHDGQAYDGQVVANTAISFGFWLPIVRGSDHSAFSLASWNVPPTVQSHPGAGIRADDYKPFEPGARRSLECWLNKTDPASFATIFSTDADEEFLTTTTGTHNLTTLASTPGAGTINGTSFANWPDSGDQVVMEGTGSFDRFSYESRSATQLFGVTYHGSGTGSIAAGNDLTYGLGTPHPTWEMGASPAGDGNQMMRYYANVNTYPLGWFDWGTDNTGKPRSDFYLAQTHHVVCNWDDREKVAEWFVDGVSMGKQTSPGYGSVEAKFDQLSHYGNFQFGWRGGSGFFPDPGNTEVFGGFFDEIAVYEYLLTPAQIAENHETGRL